jgi:putative DNA primase/helicase
MVAESNGHHAPEVLKWFLEKAEYFPGQRIERSENHLVLTCGHPAHPDEHPSMGFDLSENGRGPQILIHCRSRACNTREILAAAGLSMSDLYFDPKQAPSEGCTLAQFAKFKGFDVEFLEAEGLGDTEHWGKPAIAIPYVDLEGEPLFYRYRIALRGNPTVVSETGGKITVPFGLQAIEDAAEAGYVLIGEGESDVLTLWYHDYPAIGSPGGGNWKPEWASYLDEIPEIYVSVDPDATGEKLWSTLNESSVLRPRLGRIDF